MKRLCPSNAELPPPPPPPILLPDELIREILSSLPVRSLVQFTCVCKYWKLIISDPQFVNLHLRRSSGKNTHVAYTRLLFDLLKSHTGEASDQTSVLPHPVSLLFSSQNQKGYDLYQIENRHQLIIKVCNGLVSEIKSGFQFGYTSSCTARVRFWNPATRLWSQLSPSLHLLGPTHCTFAFGYDCLNDTYKVVVVSSIREKEQNVVNVYDKGGSCWRTIQSLFAPSLRSWTFQNGVYVSGTLNWVAKINTDVFIVVSLDLGSEESSQLSLPDSSRHHHEDLHFPLLGVLKDCLCALLNDSKRRFLVWQMKKFGAHESWTQLFTFDFEAIRRNSPSRDDFVLSENDEVLLISHGSALVLYNHRNDTFEFSRVRDRYFIDSWNVGNFVESLVLPY